MFKRLGISITTLIIVSLVIIVASKYSTQSYPPPFFYPWSYAITVTLDNPETESGTLSLVLFESYSDSRRTDPNLIDSARITSEKSKQYLPVRVLEVNELGSRKYGEYKAYNYEFKIEVPLSSNWNFEDAHLELTYINNETETLYFGDIAFINVPEDSYSSPHLKKLRALPVLNMSRWEMTGIIIELEVKEPVLLDSLEFGLSKYGIDSSQVIVLQESMDRVQDMYFEQTLDSEFPDIYHLTLEEDLDKFINASLDPGINTVIIPFTFAEKAQFSPISVLGGVFLYSANGNQYTLTLESIPYVNALPHKMSRELIEDAWR